MKNVKAYQVFFFHRFNLNVEHFCKQNMRLNGFFSFVVRRWWIRGKMSWLIHLWLQCVTFGSFTTPSSEMAYGLMTLMLTYGLPLLTILICYLGIWFRIFQTSFEHFQGTFSAIHLVSSSISFINSVVKEGNWSRFPHHVMGLDRLIDWLIQ